MPKERIDMILNELNPLIKDQRLDEHAVTPLSEVLNNSILEEELTKIQANRIDTDPIYAIYTSGSTGKPKGVL